MQSMSNISAYDCLDASVYWWGHVSYLYVRKSEWVVDSIEIACKFKVGVI